MDTCKNVLRPDTLLFEQFQKFVEMFDQFQIFLDMLEQLASSFSKWILDSGATHHMSHLL